VNRCFGTLEVAVGDVISASQCQGVKESAQALLHLINGVKHSGQCHYASAEFPGGKCYLGRMQYTDHPVFFSTARVKGVQEKNLITCNSSTQDQP
jgi:hypothetical protein